VPSGAWAWERVGGPIGDLVGAEVPDPARRLVRVVESGSTAFVLGSTQSHPGTAGTLSIVRRRSGGGGVLVVPGGLLWVDIVVPHDDPWWDDDVGRATHPIGRAWAAALRAHGFDAEIHRGPLVSSRWSRSLCFAGLGPGEVRVDGHKVLGLAQRRTRAGACFQCAVPLTPPGRVSAEAAGLTGSAADEATLLLRRAAGAIDRPAASLLDALGDSLEP
jgi:hypothetical protein